MLEASIVPLKLSQKTPTRINSCLELEQAASEATKAQGAPGSRPPVIHTLGCCALKTCSWNLQLPIVRLLSFRRQAMFSLLSGTPNTQQ